MISKRLIVAIFFSISTLALRAQDDLDQLIKGSVADADYLLKGYTTP